MTSLRKTHSAGPFKADQIRDGDPYELTNGHAYYCAPTGGTGAHKSGLAYSVIASDPAVEDAGIDPGFSPEPGSLWAPDVAVGVPANVSGWIKDVPPLAVEYAGVGQDEEALQAKISGMLARGTRWIWVVRLRGLPRVEIHAPNQPVRLAQAGDRLEAPGVLANPVPFEALFDANAARAATLSNLLQRFGYRDIADVRAEGHLEGRAEGHLEGRAEGHLEGERALLRRQLERRFGPLDASALDRIAQAPGPQLEAWGLAVLEAPDLASVLATP